MINRPRAVGVALQKDLLLLTGGPGTGKTRTIVAILAAYLQANPGMLVALAAPTGKAAFRMRESVLETMGSLDLPDSIRSALLDSARLRPLCIDCLDRGSDPWSFAETKAIRFRTT